MWYKAREIENKPYIIWDLVARTLTEYVDNYDEDPLVLPEELVPDFEFGICPLKIDAGDLIDREVGEMETASDEYSVQLNLNLNKSKLPVIDNESFTYDSTDFPMDQVSRLFYQSLEKIPGVGDVKCLTMVGTIYNLENANITAFITAFWTKLKTVSQPDDES